MSLPRRPRTHIVTLASSTSSATHRCAIDFKQFQMAFKSKLTRIVHSRWSCVRTPEGTLDLSPSQRVKLVNVVTFSLPCFVFIQYSVFFCKLLQLFVGSQSVPTVVVGRFHLRPAEVAHPRLSFQSCNHCHPKVGQCTGHVCAARHVLLHLTSPRLASPHLTFTSLHFTAFTSSRLHCSLSFLFLSSPFPFPSLPFFR